MIYLISATSVIAEATRKFEILTLNKIREEKKLLPSAGHLY